MRTIITVTEFPSMPGRYSIKCDANRDARGVIHGRDVIGAEAAAAKALEYAISRKSRGYAIIAPAKVLACIPEDMRSRA